jgi:hypothetical protein
MADVEINEMTSHVQVVDSAAMISPAAMKRIVEAVMAALASANSAQKTLKSDLDTRSIVDQQRGGKR